MNQSYYEEKIKTLPENLQYAVMMSDWKKILINIQSKFKLHVDQTQVLEDSVIKLMFGDIDAPDFIANMFSNGHVNSETAADILLDIDLQILKPIRQRLEDMEKEETEEEGIDTSLLSDEEKEDRDNAEVYAKFYSDMEQVKDDVESGKLEFEPEETEIPTNIDQEKIDLLKEIEQPSRAPSSTISINPTPAATQQDITPINPDHQLQNIEIEKPYHEEEIISQTTNKVEIKTETKPEQPQPKKPTTINLNDIYREPIE